MRKKREGLSGADLCERWMRVSKASQPSRDEIKDNGKMKKDRDEPGRTLRYRGIPKETVAEKRVLCDAAAPKLAFIKKLA